MYDLTPNAGTMLSTTGFHRKRISFQKAEIIYAITRYFDKYYLKSDNTNERPMLQLASEGMQSIVDDSQHSHCFKEGEFIPIQNAIVCMEKLLMNYTEYIRSKGFRQWDVHSTEWERTREIARKNHSVMYFKHMIRTLDPETIANIAIFFIRQTDDLLIKQMNPSGLKKEKIKGFLSAWPIGKLFKRVF